MTFPKIDWRERLRTLSYTYAAVAFGLAICVLLDAVKLFSLNFFLTSVAAFGMVTVFDVFLLAVLNEEKIGPTHFLFRMMVIVVAMQAAFACIYYFAADATTYLAREGRPITDFVDALYFSGVTLLTVGYGDIVPRGDFRFTAVAEVYGGTLFIFAFFTWGLSVVAGRHLGNRK